MSLLRTLAAAAALLALCSTVGDASGPPTARPAALAAPALERTGRVTDAAAIIPADVEQRLAERLAQFERRTRHQMVVVTVPTLAGRDVAEVADHLGNTWGIGRAGHDDGIVLLVAPNDRRVRISTGAGIRVLLPDSACRRIIDEVMTPHFRNGDLAGGIEAGTDAIITHFD